MDALEEQLRDIDQTEMVLVLSTETRAYSKPVTIISGFKGSNSEAKELLSSLKRNLATGGAWKEKKIMLQGDQREMVRDFLVSNGYKVA